MNDIATSAVSVAGTVVAYAGQRAIDAVVDKVAAAIIRPCAERRGHAFFHKLAEVLAGQVDGQVSPEAVGAALDRVMADDPARETVYEFYRKSVLSRSRETGPRLLALLAARLVQERRIATEAENEVAEVAETCTDDDLKHFLAYFARIMGGEGLTDAERVRKESSGYLVRLRRETGASDWPFFLPTNPLSLYSELGAWAAKFERAGAVKQRIKVDAHRYDDDPERHVDVSGVARQVEWFLWLGDACQDLFTLLPLATPRPG